MSETALKQAILFFGVVSFLLSKAALNGASRPRPEQLAENDPVVRALREAGA